MRCRRLAQKDVGPYILLQGLGVKVRRRDLGLISIGNGEEDDRRPKEDEWAGEWSNSDEWDGDSGYQDNIWPPGEASSEIEVEDQPRGRTRKRKSSTAWDGLLELDPDLHR